MGKEILPKAKGGPGMCKMIIILISVCISKKITKKSLWYDLWISRTKKTYPLWFMKYDGWQRKVSNMFKKYNRRQKFSNSRIKLRRFDRDLRVYENDKGIYMLLDGEDLPNLRLYVISCYFCFCDKGSLVMLCGF